jgi:hypothetical protein
MDWKQGCVRSGNWSCGVKNKDGFRKFIGIKFPDTTNSWINANMTLEECKTKCLKNCSCTGYTSLDPIGGGKGCSIWLGDLIDLRFSQDGQDLYVRMDSAYIGKKFGIILRLHTLLSNWNHHFMFFLLTHICRC